MGRQCENRSRQGRIALTVAALILGLGLCAMGLYATRMAQAQSTLENPWMPLAQPAVPGGTVVDLAISPTVSETLYSLMEELDGPRLFRSLDAAQNWEKRYTFTQTMISLAVDPFISTTVYAGGESGLYRSLDGGLSWTQVYTLGQVFTVVSPTLIYAGGQIAPPIPYSCWSGEIGVGRSQDGGLTWQESSLGCQGELNVMAFEPGNPLTLYVGGSLDWKTPTLWRSTDSGEHWESLSDDLYPHSPIQSLAIDPLDSERLYISNNEGVFISPDGGLTWHLVEGLPYSLFRLATSSSYLYAAPNWGDKIHIYRSQDDGDSWWVSLATLPDGANVLEPDPQRPGHLYAGLLNDGIWRSEAYGGDWKEANQGIDTPAWISALAAQPGQSMRLYAGSDYPRGGLFQSDDGGLNWTTVLTNTLVNAIVFHPFIPTIAYAAGENGVYRTLDGENWEGFWYSIEASDLAFSHHPEPWLFVGGYCVDRQQGCVLSYRPNPSQTSWIWATNFITNSMEIQSVATDPFNPSLVYAGGEHQTKLSAFWLSPDGGDTWQEATSTRFFYLSDILVDPLRRDWIYVSAFDGMYLSRDGGGTWERYVAGFFPASDTMTSLVEDELGFLFASSNDGVFAWDSFTSLWTPAGLQGEPLGTLIHLPGRSPALLAGGQRGLWRRDLPPVQRIWFPVIYR
jgi:photosystem II stability/assembly factor-like uncharacterized protein